MTGTNWFFYALGAALLWAVGFVIAEKLLHMGLKPAFIIFFDALIVLPFYLVLAYGFGEIREGFALLFSQRALWLAVLSAITIIGGNFLVILSVNDKNATLASVVESTYPIFTFLLAWLVLKEIQITWQTALGGIMVLGGVAVLALKG